MKKTIICTFEDHTLAEMALHHLHIFLPDFQTVYSVRESFSPSAIVCESEVITILCEEQDCPALVDRLASMGAQRVEAQN